MGDTIFKVLNEEQQDAVAASEGYVHVIAGAGSGKTKVLTTRYLYLHKIIGIDADHILSVTFTNKAANEMKSRIQRQLQDDAGRWICTFHSTCHKILKEDIHYLSYPQNFSVLDESDQKKLLEKIFRENNFTLKNTSYNACLDYISYYKSCRAPDYVDALTSPAFSGIFPKLQITTPNKFSKDFIIQQYLIEQRKNWYLDFDDLMYFTLFLFKTNESVLQKWQNQFEYIQVDEFQDVNATQYYFVDLLSKKHKNLFIVGDPDQTIYSWRGANVSFFLDFDKTHENVNTLTLNKNYRSTPEILNVSNVLIRYNKQRLEKDLFPIKRSGDSVIYYHAKSQEEENNWISSTIQKLHETEEVNFADIAVLYRSAYMTKKIEDSFLRNKIPYKIYSGIEFFNRKEIKDALAYLKMVAFGDDVSFLRTVNTPSRGIGETKIAKLSLYAKNNNMSLFSALKLLATTNSFIKTKAIRYIDLIEKAKEKVDAYNVLDLLDYLLKNSDYEEMLMLDGDQDRLDNITELKDSMRHQIESEGEDIYLEDFLNQLALITNSDAIDKSSCVKMMTVHTAKGLEFPYVFVCCLNEGLFPSQRVRDIYELEEERRLAYVAFTRAEKRLYLSNAEGYSAHINGELLPSRFVFNIDQDNNIEKQGEASDDYINIARAYIENSEKQLENYQVCQKQPFHIGDSVLHPNFGKGIIEAMTDFNLTIKFSDTIIRTITIDNPHLTLLQNDSNNDELDLGALSHKDKFNVNDRVDHIIFGSGTIISTEGDSYTIQFDSGKQRQFTKILANIIKI